ncbi:hypothetical protein BC831DRAFT_442507 [Entophlyctis helioformis]|nr:hypothetical protein BC831DRAFT_442507 [Entophlyctis helioformis]
MAVRFALVAGINLFLQWQMESLAASGTDLAQEGTLLSYYYDTIYIGWFVMVTVCVSDSFYWAYLAVPLFAAYKLSKLASSLFGLATGGSSAGTADTNGSAKTAKASSKPAAKARKPAAGAR